MNFSPKLKEAMAEIRAILRKHDIGAHVILHEPGFSEFLMRIDPTWSVMRYETQRQLGIRFRALLEEFGGDKAAQKKAINDSVNLVVHLRDLLSRDAVLMERLYEMLRERFEITETEAIETPHREH